jgi:tripeptidyl-peptidase-1
MGFLDPWLYATGTGWHGFMGVVDGSAVGCGGMGSPAQRGWDAVTECGTPWFPGVRELAFNVAARGDLEGWGGGGFGGWGRCIY